MKSDRKNARNIEERLSSLLRLPPLGAEGVDSERVLDRLRDAARFRKKTTSHRRIDEATYARQTPWRVAVIFAAVAASLVLALSPTLWKTPPAVLRAVGDSSTTKTLADGSRIEMRAGAEAVVKNVTDGLLIRLNSGDMMVFAAKQAAGRHLYVHTKDLSVSVVGTVFLVNADDKGSRVAVIEGEVHVQQGTVETSLRPGEQLASNPNSENLKFFRETGWSREAFAYLSKLHESMAQSLAARQSLGQATSVSDKPKFEEASIRLCEQDIQGVPGRGAGTGGSGSMRLSQGRVDALCMTVATLIERAHRPLNNNPPLRFAPKVLPMNQTWNIPSEDGTRVRGGPNWVRSDRYTIAAVGASTDAATLQGPMLLDLLERRFQLKLRVESEETPVYALTIAKGGLKIKPLEIDSVKYEELRKIRASSNRFPTGRSEQELATYAGLLGCSFPPQAVLNDRVELSRFREAVRRGLQPPECFYGGYTNGPNFVITSAGSPISSLVGNLSGGLAQEALEVTLNGLVVVDKTGLPDTNCLIAIPSAGTLCAPLFNIVVEYAIDEDASHFGSLNRSLPKAPNIFDALEKLGLHLEKGKASREFILIEQIERPS